MVIGNITSSSRVLVRVGVVRENRLGARPLVVIYGQGPILYLIWARPICVDMGMAH